MLGLIFPVRGSTVIDCHVQGGEDHRIPYLYKCFSAKEPYNQRVFAENDLQFNASYGSSPPCSCSYLANVLLLFGECLDIFHIYTHSFIYIHIYIYACTTTIAAIWRMSRYITYTHTHTYIYIYMYICVCVCVCGLLLLLLGECTPTRTIQLSIWQKSQQLQPIAFAESFLQPQNSILYFSTCLLPLSVEKRQTRSRLKNRME